MELNETTSMKRINYMNVRSRVLEQVFPGNPVIFELFERLKLVITLSDDLETYRRRYPIHFVMQTIANKEGKEYTFNNSDVFDAAATSMTPAVVDVYEEIIKCISAMPKMK